MEEREKEMIGASENQPTAEAIQAHQRGKDDLERARMLLEQSKLTPNKARRLVQDYAALGDVHSLALRFNMHKNDVERFLRSLDINSIEDAKRIMRSGSSVTLFNTEFDDYIEASKAEAALTKERSEQLEEHAETFSKDPVVKSAEAADEQLRELRGEMEERSKSEQKRLALQRVEQAMKEAEGFRIPQAREGEFKRLVIMSIESARRQFGGTKKQIRAEARRLLPGVDVDMLR